MNYKKVREGVFETNSSSTHSISICNMNPDDVMNHLPVDGNGTLTIPLDGEFGWEFDSYNDVYSKTQYLAISSESSPKQREKLEYVLKKQTGCDRVEYVRDNGYIDHQSHGICNEVLAKADLIRDFIFNPNSFLDTGNDNSDTDLPKRQCDHHFGYEGGHQDPYN